MYFRYIWIVEIVLFIVLGGKVLEFFSNIHLCIFGLLKRYGH